MKYVILADSVTGKRSQPYRAGEIVEASQLIDAHIAGLVTAKAIEVYVAPVVEIDDAKKDEKKK